jgi:hypothetical protein
VNDYRSPFAPPEQDDQPTAATADASTESATPADAEVIPPAVAPFPSDQDDDTEQEDAGAEKPAERRTSSTRRRARRKAAEKPSEDLDAALAKLDAARGKADE